MGTLEHLLRPRLLLGVPALALAAWWVMGVASGSHPYDENTDRVKAWYNPRCVVVEVVVCGRSGGGA
jgi:hypothetical protein